MACVVLERSYNPLKSEAEYRFDEFESNAYLIDTVKVSETSFYVIDLMRSTSLGYEEEVNVLKLKCDSILVDILKNRQKLNSYHDSIKINDPLKVKLLDSLNKTRDGQVKQYEIINGDLINWYNSSKK
jgi:hypothetical protein